MSNNDKISAHNHEDDEHFEPMMQKLGAPWQNMYQSANPQDKEDLWYIIRNHMSLKNDLWSKRLWDEMIDDQGKYKNDRKVKLLILLVLMDKMGRFGDKDPQFGLANGLRALNSMQRTADLVLKKRQNQNPKQVTFASRDDFINHLKQKGVDPKVIDASVRNKYGS